MNRTFRFLVLAALVTSVAGISGAPLNFTARCDKKRFEYDRSGNTSTLTTTEKWGYAVTIENRSFKAIEGLEVQYKQFKLDDQLKGSKLVGIAGSTPIGTLRNGEKFTFDTVPISMERAELRTGWTYADGSKSKVKDSLAGLWLRIVQNGEVVFEWQNPTDLKSKAKWD